MTLGAGDGLVDGPLPDPGGCEGATTGAGIAPWAGGCDWVVVAGGIAGVDVTAAAETTSAGISGPSAT